MIRILSAIGLLLLSLSSQADAQVVMRASNLPYSQFPAVVNASVRSMLEVRVAALSAAAGAYRAMPGQNPLTALPVGRKFKLVYTDGSSEEALVVSLSSNVGAEPVPGTQQDAPATGGGGGGSGSGGGGLGYGGGLVLVCGSVNGGRPECYLVPRHY